MKWNYVNYVNLYVYISDNLNSCIVILYKVPCNYGK